MPVDVVRLIRACIPHSWLGFNRDGYLVFLECTGRMDITKLFASVRTSDGKPDIDQLLRYHVLCMEYQQRFLLPRESKRRGMLLDKLAVIMDLHGLGRRHLTSIALSALQKQSRIDQDNYPECLGKLFIVNAPWIFSTVWSIIKGFLDKNVQDKIRILSASTQTQILLDEIGAEYVPRYLGGELESEGPSETPTCDPSGYITPLQQEFDELDDLDRERREQGLLPAS